MKIRYVVSLVLLPLSATLAVNANAAPPIPVKCRAEKPQSVWRAKYGSFEVQEGAEVQKRPGNVGRTPFKGDTCNYDVAAGDTLLFVYDAKAKPVVSSTMAFAMQCVDAVTPNGKKMQYDVLPKVGEADPKDWTPPCAASGLNAAEKKACSPKDTQTDRADFWAATRTKTKTYALDVTIISGEERYASRADGPSAYEVAPSGKLFCQYYNRDDKNVLFTFTFDVPKK